ncbi:MAG: hypothetical protein ACHQE6_03160 [Solirubrobacterales bacterium]
MDWTCVMRRAIARGPIAAALLATGLAIAGCGGSSTRSSSQASAGTTGVPLPSSTPTTTPAQPTTPTSTTSSPPSSTEPASAHVPPVTIKLSALGLGPKPEYPIPRNNTCDGANVPLSFTWSNVPHGTAELALFVLSLQSVNGESVFVDWAVAGLGPGSRGIAAGKLPGGAVVLTNGFGRAGYSICPPKGTNGTFLARLVALPHRLAIRPGLDGKTLFQEAEAAAGAVGVSGAGSYSRQ